MLIQVTHTCSFRASSRYHHRNILSIKFLILLNFIVNRHHILIIQKMEPLNRPTNFHKYVWLFLIWGPEIGYFLNLILQNISLWCPPLLFCTVRLQKHHTSFKQSSLCLLHPSCFRLDFVYKSIHNCSDISLKVWNSNFVIFRIYLLGSLGNKPCI